MRPEKPTLYRTNTYSLKLPVEIDEGLEYECRFCGWHQEEPPRHHPKCEEFQRAREADELYMQNRYYPDRWRDIFFVATELMAAHYGDQVAEGFTGSEHRDDFARFAAREALITARVMVEMHREMMDASMSVETLKAASKATADPE